MTVFFDVDGVLNNKSQWNRSYQLNADCIKEFCKLIKDLNATLVIASSWRTGFLRSASEQNYIHIKSLERLLSVNGVTITGKTPVIEQGKRDEEIALYLESHPDRYIVIDDDPREYGVINNHIYFTDANTGFTKGDYKKAMTLAKKI